MVDSIITRILVGIVVFGSWLTLHTSRTLADDFVIVVGAGGTSDYSQAFQSWAEKWQTAVQSEENVVTVIGDELSDAFTTSAFEGANDRERFLTAIASLAEPQTTEQATDPVWIVYFGHGTFGGNVANLNLVGPDVSAKVIADALQSIERPLVFIDTSACSGPFVDSLTGNNRVIVTATRSGDEVNFARFGGYLAQSLNAVDADLDHDDRISLLEAFLHASSSTANFYDLEDRLLTEHSLIEDNGDGRGTPMDFFRGVRVIKSAQNNQIPDGEFARQLILTELIAGPVLSNDEQSKLTELETRLAELRIQKDAMDADDYYSQVEKICTQIAIIEQRSFKKNPSDPSTEQEAAEVTNNSVDDAEIDSDNAPR